MNECVVISDGLGFRALRLAAGVRVLLSRGLQQATARAGLDEGCLGTWTLRAIFYSIVII